MALGTLEELREHIKDTLKRTDLAGEIDNFIRLAEARHNREIRIREMITRAPITIGTRFVALPAGFREGITLTLPTDPRTVLIELAPHRLAVNVKTGNGTPHFFTIHNEFEFDVTPDQAFAGEIVFYKDLTPLDEANPTNALLTRAPDAYLYAALLESAPYLMDDPRLQVWSGLYGAARDGLDVRKDTKMGPQVARVHGATP